MNENTVKIGLLGNSRRIFQRIWKKERFRSNSSLMELNNSEENEPNDLSFVTRNSTDTTSTDTTSPNGAELFYCDHCDNTSEHLQQKKHVSILQKKISHVTNISNIEPRHLSGDFLGSMLFPHLQKKKHGKSLLGVTINSSTTSSDLIKELFIPSPSPLNVKLFGGHRAVELERERSRNSGYIIHPCSKLRQYWDLVIMTMLILNMFILPLDISFFTDSYNRPWLSFHISSDILCIIDIILNFRTGYRPSQELNEFELNQRKIAVHYLKTWFSLDIFSSLPFHYIVLIASGETENFSLGLKGASRALKILKVAKLLNLLKLLRLSRIIRGISQYEEVYCLTTGFMRYIKLVSMMLIVSHWNGCLHFLAPMLQDFPDDCWVKLCKLQDEPWYIQYGWALFKTLSHMLCIGYGRFIPVLLSEAIITIFTMVTGATFYALFIAHSMAYIIQNDSSKNTYQEKFKQIDEYLTYRQLPDATKKRVNDYFERKYHQGRFFDESKVLSEVSPPLRDEIVNHTCRDLVENIPFLKAGSNAFISALLNKLTYEVYLSGDVIMKEGTMGNEMFFMRKGNAEVTVNNVFLQSHDKGAYFGDIDLDDILEEYTSMRPVFEHAAINRLIEISNECELTSIPDDYCEQIYNEIGINYTSLKQLHDVIIRALYYFHGSKIDKTADKKLITLLRSVIAEHKKFHSGCTFCDKCSGFDWNDECV